jgi:pterin-4a-carbinolamine dehydratase
MAPPDWDEVDGALERTFEFRNFVEALAFVNRVGELA